MQPWERFSNLPTENPVTPPVQAEGTLQPWQRTYGTRDANAAPSREEREDYNRRTTGWEGLRNSPRNLATAARIAGRGIPVVGNFINETDDTREMRRMEPTASTIAEVGTGIAATYPMMAAGPVGSTLLRQLGIAGAKGAGLNLADAETSANAPKDLSERTIRGAMGMLGGVGGTALNRVISPAGIVPRSNLPQPIVPPNRILPPQLAGINRTPVPTVNNQNVPQNASGVSDVLSSTLGNMTMGAAAGHLMSGDLQGALYGAAAGAAGRKAINKYSQTGFGRGHLGLKISPNEAAILNSLGAYAPTMGQ